MAGVGFAEYHAAGQVIARAAATLDEADSTAGLDEIADGVRFAGGGGTSDYWRGFNDGIDKLVAALSPSTPPEPELEERVIEELDLFYAFVIGITVGAPTRITKAIRESRNVTRDAIRKHFRGGRSDG
jgi:hypothetical protein